MFLIFSSTGIFAHPEPLFRWTFMMLDIPSTGAEGACQIGFRDTEGPSRHVIKRAAGPCSLGKPVLQAEPHSGTLSCFGGQADPLQKRFKISTQKRLSVIPH
jgi:hypothetical protein